jgi:hypothetical protein
MRSEDNREITPTTTVAEEVDRLPSYRFGGRYDIDEIVAEELDASH